VPRIAASYNSGNNYHCLCRRGKRSDIWPRQLRHGALTIAPAPSTCSYKSSLMRGGCETIGMIWLNAPSRGSQWAHGAKRHVAAHLKRFQGVSREIHCCEESQVPVPLRMSSNRAEAGLVQRLQTPSHLSPKSLFPEKAYQDTIVDLLSCDGCIEN